MRVSAVMSARVLTARPEESVREAGELMQRHGYAMLPVVDAEGKLVGIFSEADLLRAILPSYLDEMKDLSFVRGDIGMVERLMARLDEHSVGDAMRSRDLYTVEEDDSVLELVHEMLQHGYHRVPVVREGKLVGIVSRTDIVRELLRPRLGTGSEQ